jgi:hypothetical protein
MVKAWAVVGFLIVAAAALSWTVPASHTSSTPSTQPIQESGAICGTHHCAPGASCCLSCTGELRCYGGTRCPECAQP